MPGIAYLVPLDVTNLYPNIQQEEGIIVICNAHENFHSENPQIPTHFLREIFSLILREKSFQFNGKHYLQKLIHEKAICMKMVVAFANNYMASIEIYMASIEEEILSNDKPLT